MNAVIQASPQRSDKSFVVTRDGEHIGNLNRIYNGEGKMIGYRATVIGLEDQTYSNVYDAVGGIAEKMSNPFYNRNHITGG